MGFKQNHYDECIFVKDNVIVLLYVDDLLIISPGLKEIHWLESELKLKYHEVESTRASILLTILLFTSLLIKSDIYLLTSRSSIRIFFFVWVMGDLPLSDDRAVLLSSASMPSCQLLLSAPIYGHHAYGDNIGLVRIHVILRSRSIFFIQSE